MVLAPHQVSISITFISIYGYRALKATPIVRVCVCRKYILCQVQGFWGKYNSLRYWAPDTHQRHLRQTVYSLVKCNITKGAPNHRGPCNTEEKPCTMGAQQCAGVQDLYVVKTTDDSQVRSSGVPPAQGNTHTLCTYSFYFETPTPNST